jgi:biotin carboxyl carrier protein
MSQEPSIEAARARIQRLVEEIAALSRKEMRSEEYFAEFLSRVVQACDAKGGAVWLVGQRAADGKSEFQLAAQVEFESSLFQSDEQMRAVILKLLTEVVQTKKPLALPGSAAGRPDPSSLTAQLAQMQGEAPTASQNKTPYPFLHIPLFLKEQVLGVLQVWLQPYVTPQNYNEFAVFLGGLAAQVEQHLQSRRLGNLVLENNRLQHVLKFTSDLAGSLDPLEVARLAANYGRDLLGCERCSILTLEGGHWKVLSISGQEVVEKKSSMVKAMAAFVGAHAAAEGVVLSKKELLSRAEAAQNGGEVETTLSAATNSYTRTDAIDLAYFELSHVVSAAIAPMLDKEKALVGAYFAESTAEGFFDGAPGAKEASQSSRLADFLATHTTRSLQAAQDYHSLPFLGVTRRIRDARVAVTGPHRRRVLLRTFVILAILLAILFYPRMDSVDGHCAVVPVVRSGIVAEVPGRVDKVLVRENQHVKKGDPIAQLDVRRLETELAQNEQERLRLLAEAERYRGGPQPDEAGAQVALIQARAAEQNGKKLQLDIAAATLRSPIDGVVLTKDLELRTGEFIQAGTTFAEVAALNDWMLQIDVPEKKIGKIEKYVPKTGDARPLDVRYILYSQSALKLMTRLSSHDEISAAAHPRDTENVFIISLKDLALSEDLKPALRPGLTGRASVELGRKPLCFIWAQRVWDWARLKWLH